MDNFKTVTDVKEKMAENDKCSFCDHVGITPVSNKLTTVTYPLIEKKVKLQGLEKRDFVTERKVHVKHVTILTNIFKMQTLLVIVVYFEQHLGAAHPKRWSK